MTAAIQKARDEQVRCATLLLAGHPEQHGLRMSITDWVTEEIMLTNPEMWPSVTRLDAGQVANNGRPVPRSTAVRVAR